MAKPIIHRNTNENGSSLFTAVLENYTAIAGLAFIIGGDITLFVTAAANGNVVAEWDRSYADTDAAYADFEEWVLDFNNQPLEVAP